MRFLAVLLCVVCLHATDDLLDRIIAAQAGATGLAGTFVQTTTRPGDEAGAGTVYQGRFALRLPASYDILYRDPRDAEYLLRHVSDGTTQWQIEQMLADQPADVITTPAADDKEGFGRRLSEIIRLDRSALERDFTLVARPTEDGGAIVELTPRSTDLSARLSALTVTFTADWQPLTITISEPQGNRIVIVLADLQRDPEFPAGTFVWPTP